MTKHYSCILIFMLTIQSGIAQNIDILRKGKSYKKFPTIQGAVNEAKPGDVIRLKEGVYYEQVIIENISGAEGAPVVISGKGKVVMDVADKELQKNGNGRWKLSADGVYEAEVPWKGDQWRAPNTWVTKTDETLLAAYTKDEYFLGSLRGSGTQRGDGKFMPAEKVRIKFNDATDPNKTGLNIAVSEAGITFTNSAYWTIENIEIRHAGYAGILIKDERSHHITCHKVNFLSSCRGFSTEDFNKGPSHIKLLNCKVKNDLGAHKKWNAFYSYRDTRPSTGNGDSKGKPSHGFGIMLYKSDYSEVANCEVDGQWDGGHINGKNVSIHDCVFKNCTDDGVELESWGSDSLRFFNNTLMYNWGNISVGSNPGGPMFIYRNYVDATTVFLTDKNPKAGYCIKFGDDFAKGTENIKFYHNTFFGDEVIHIWGTKSRPEAFRGIEFINNLILATGDNSAINSLWVQVPCNKGNYVNGNLYCRKSSVDKIRETCPEFERQAMIFESSIADIKAKLPVVTRDKGLNYVKDKSWPDSEKIKDGKSDIGATEYK